MGLDHFRQKDIFDPINQKYKVVVFGAGSLGSFVTLNLSKLGIDDILVYDFDYVENINIPNQFYRYKDIGKLKVEALKDMIKEFCDSEIKIKNEEVTNKTNLPLDLNILYVLTFDSLKSRKIVFELLKDINCIVMDVRAGGEEFNIQVVDTSKEKEKKLWEKSFNIEETVLPCSAKSIIYTNLVIAGEVCNIVKKINNGEIYPNKIMRHMKNYDILNDLKNKK